MQTNISSVNATNLTNVVKLARLVLDELVASDTTDAFIKPTNADELTSFNEQTDAIIINKLRTKLKV